MSDMKKQFEAWAKSSGYEVNRSNICYVNMFTEVAWQAWQASCAALVVELPDSVWSNLQDDEVMTSESIKHALDAAGVAYK